MTLFYLVLVFLVITTRTSAQDDKFSDPLFLTSYIESGNITEGRRLAWVPFTNNIGVQSYAGFFTVNKVYNSNMFFWYFPPVVPKNQTAPVLLWLNGGPGGSSLIGLFTSNGPILMRDKKFERRKYNWALNYHIFYIDNPVGTGFSFTESPKGYRTDQTQVGADLYSAVVQFFKLFPELQESKFFITGQSYAGKYIPALAYTIHKNNPTAALKINLHGIALGNAICDPINQMVYSVYLHKLGLLDYNQAQVFANYEDKIIEYIKEKKWLKAERMYTKLLLGGRNNEVTTVFTKLTGFNYFYNFLYSESNMNLDFQDMLAKTYVKQGLHVGHLPFNNGTVVRNALMADFMKSVAPWLSVLIDNYKVLIYNGQLDITFGFVSSENFLRKLKSDDIQYEMAVRHVWRVDDEIAGYVKRAGNLVHVLVRNAGHMVPMDQPKWTLDMITRFIENRWDDL